MSQEYFKQFVLRNLLPVILTFALLGSILYDLFLSESTEDQLRAQIRTLSSEYSRVSSEKDEVTTKLDASIDNGEALSESLATLQSSSTGNNTNEILEETILSLRSELADLQEANTNLIENNIQSAEVSPNSTSNEFLVNTIQSLRSELASLEEENQLLTSSGTNNNDPISDDASRQDDLLEQLQAARLELESSLSTNRNLEEGFDRISSQVEELNTTTESLNADLERDIYVKSMNVDLDRCADDVRENRVCIEAFLVNFEFSRKDSSTIELTLRQPNGREFATHRFQPEKSSLFRFSNEDPEVFSGEYEITLELDSEDIYTGSFTAR